MKAILKISFLLVFLFATLFYNIRFSYLLGFHTLNNESFTELYCVNIDKPSLECNGKCALTKAGESNNANDDPGRLENYQKEISFFYFEELFECVEFLNDLKKHSLMPYHNLYDFQFTENILHPPSRLI